MRKKQVWIFVFMVLSLFFLVRQPHTVRADPLSENGSHKSSLLHIFTRQKPVPVGEHGRHVCREVKFIAGNDGTWFSPDDVVYNYFIYEFDNSGRTVRKKTYTSGRDREGFTADDQLQEYAVYTYDEKMRLIKETAYNGKGADKSWFTPDDIQAYFYLYDYDLLGEQDSAVKYRNNGESSGCVTFEHNLKEQLVKDAFYRHDKREVQCFQARGKLEKYHIFEYNNEGQLIRAVEYNDRGRDRQWFTPDDGICAYKVCSYDSQGFQSLTKKYIGKGADNRWFTGDDIMQYYVAYSYIEITAKDKALHAPVS
ncbi:MAG: hypothetical protein PHF11_07945 [Candidatus Omnitrophica bacterium]|nr:hypothetical protein [Candidatus Omnitrophota bacterium]